jgi:superfamily II DNA or RNA helicase
MTTSSGFLDDRRLLAGPWQAFERDVARLLVANGFDDVRIVAGSGDRGADVIGVKASKLWVFQCKHTTSTPPPSAAIREVVEAGKFYGADRLVIASSRPAGESLLRERRRYERLGLKIELAQPDALLGMMRQTPEYSVHRKTLHPYQEEASTRFRAGLVDTGRGQAVLATGLGKTVIMAEVCADLLRDNLVPHKRILVLAHVKELVHQLQQNFWYQLPKWVSTHRLAEGEVPTYWDGITFATIQSASSRLDELPEFGLVLVDEAHHVGAESFREVLAALNPAFIGGVTATPWRGDGYDIDQLLGPAVVKVGIAEGLQRGFLAEVDYRLLGDNLDWSFVQDASRFGYSLSQLNRRLIIPTRDEQAVRIVKDVFENEERHSAIAYSPTTVHATAFAAMLRRYGFKAEVMSNETPARERDVLMSRFRAGQLDVLTTVDLFNEGVDVPDVDLLIFMRATHSRRIFVQQLGRGLRVRAGKNKVVVLDFVTDLRRIAEVIQLDAAVRGGSVEQLGLGGRLIEFSNRSAGSFLREWILDQASLFDREDDPTLQMPHFDFPHPAPPGGVQ